MAIRVKNQFKSGGPPRKKERQKKKFKLHDARKNARAARREKDLEAQAAQLTDQGPKRKASVRARLGVDEATRKSQAQVKRYEDFSEHVLSKAEHQSAEIQRQEANKNFAKLKSTEEFKYETNSQRVIKRVKRASEIRKASDAKVSKKQTVEIPEEIRNSMQHTVAGTLKGVLSPAGKNAARKEKRHSKRGKQKVSKLLVDNSKSPKRRRPQVKPTKPQWVKPEKVGITRLDAYGNMIPKIIPLTYTAKGGVPAVELRKTYSMKFRSPDPVDVDRSGAGEPDHMLIPAGEEKLVLKRPARGKGKPNCKPTLATVTTAITRAAKKAEAEERKAPCPKKAARLERKNSRGENTHAIKRDAAVLKRQIAADIKLAAEVRVAAEIKAKTQSKQDTRAAINAALKVQHEVIANTIHEVENRTVNGSPRYRAKRDAWHAANPGKAAPAAKKLSDLTREEKRIERARKVAYAEKMCEIRAAKAKALVASAG